MPIPIVPTSGIIEQTPDPFQKSYKLRIARNNTKGRVEIQTSRDEGLTYKVLLPELSTKTKAGSVPIVQENGEVEWQPIPAPSSAASNTYTYVDLHCFGTIASGDIFGYYAAPASTGMKCLGIQVTLQTPATGAAVRIDFVTLAGTEQSKVTSLPAAASYVQNLFATPLSMPAASAWRLKLKQVGSTLAGEFLSVRLILIPA